MRRSKNLHVHLPLRIYVLDKKMSVRSTAGEDSGNKHSTEMGFCSL